MAPSEARGESSFPQAWKFDEDGLRIEGTYLRLDEGLRTE